MKSREACARKFGAATRLCLCSTGEVGPDLRAWDSADGPAPVTGEQPIGSALPILIVVHFVF